MTDSTMEQSAPKREFTAAEIGPIPGVDTFTMGVFFHGTWLAIAVFTLRYELRNRRKPALIAIG